MNTFINVKLRKDAKIVNCLKLLEYIKCMGLSEDIEIHIGKDKNLTIHKAKKGFYQ